MCWTYWTDPCTIDLEGLFSEAHDLQCFVNAWGHRWHDVMDVYCPFLKLVAHRTSIDPHHYIIPWIVSPWYTFGWVALLHSGFQFFIFCFISAFGDVTLSGQINGIRLCEVPVRVLSEFNYLFQIFQFHFYTLPGLNMLQYWSVHHQLSTSRQNSGCMWGCAAYSTIRLPFSGIIMLKMDVAKFWS